MISECKPSNFNSKFRIQIFSLLLSFDIKMSIFYIIFFLDQQYKLKNHMIENREKSYLSLDVSITTDKIVALAFSLYILSCITYIR